MRTMVAFKLLLVGRSAGIRPSGCTGNTWKVRLVYSLRLRLRLWLGLVGLY